MSKNGMQIVQVIFLLPSVSLRIGRFYQFSLTIITITTFSREAIFYLFASAFFRHGIKGTLARTAILFSFAFPSLPPSFVVAFVGYLLSLRKCSLLSTRTTYIRVALPSLVEKNRYCDVASAKVQLFLPSQTREETTFSLVRFVYMICL